MRTSNSKPSRRDGRGGRDSRRPEPRPHPTAPARAAGSRAVPCPHFPRCVGCPLVGTAYAEQLASKDARLREALAEDAQLAAAIIDDPVGSPEPFGYRNQAKLVFRTRYVPPDRREVLLGVYRPGTHSVAPADGCIVHHPRLRPLLRTLRDEVERLAMPVYDERVRTGALRYALVRTATAQPEVHLTLVSAVADPPQLDELLCRLRRAHPELTATYLCVNPTPGNTILSPDIRLLHGSGALLERFGALALESRPDAFLQANSAVAAQIYATACDWLEPRASDVALDLYCGVGALALHLAPHVARVVGVEAQPAAVACAVANATRAGAANVAFVAATVEDTPRVIAAQALGAVDLCAVNPPRKGLSAAGVEMLAATSPRRVVYVSCDPCTLARDLSLLAKRGYRLDRVRAFDMLPQTPHVEAVALLVRSD